MSAYHATERAFDHAGKCFASVFLIVVSIPFVCLVVAYEQLSGNSSGVVGATFVAIFGIGIAELLHARKEILEGANK